MGEKEEEEKKKERLLSSRRVRELYEIKGLTQEEFADRIGISTRQLSRILNGSYGLTSNTLMGIINAFPDTSIDWIMGKKDACRTKAELHAKNYRKSNEKAHAVNILLASAGFQIDFENAYNLFWLPDLYFNVIQLDGSREIAITEDQFDNMVSDIVALIQVYMKNVVKNGKSMFDLMDDYAEFTKEMIHAAKNYYIEYGNGREKDAREAVESFINFSDFYLDHFNKLSMPANNDKVCADDIIDKYYKRYYEASEKFDIDEDEEENKDEDDKRDNNEGEG